MKKLAPTANTSFSLLSFLAKECCVYRVLTLKIIKVSTLNFNYVPEKIFHFKLKLKVFNVATLSFTRIFLLAHLITMNMFLLFAIVMISWK